LSFFNITLQLEIYDKPILAQEVVMPDPPSDLEVKVSTGRRQVLSYWDSVKVNVSYWDSVKVNVSYWPGTV
jgi:hypothetical protein